MVEKQHFVCIIFSGKKITTKTIMLRKQTSQQQKNGTRTHFITTVCQNVSFPIQVSITLVLYYVPRFWSFFITIRILISIVEITKKKKIVQIIKLKTKRSAFYQPFGSSVGVYCTNQVPVKRALRCGSFTTIILWPLTFFFLSLF